MNMDLIYFYLTPLAVLFMAAALFLILKTKKIKTADQGKGSKAFSKSSYLKLYSKDLTVKAKEGKLDPVIGREKEIEEVIQILARRTKNNPVLLGKAGVGKTAIAEGLAQSIVEGRVPEALMNKKVLVLDLSAILAGTEYRGEFEQRLTRIAEEIINSNRTIILFIDEIHTLTQAGQATGAINAGDILKPALARGDLQVVGATTIVEYQEKIKNDPTLSRRLQPVMIKEPGRDDTIEILKGVRSRYEEHHKVKISDRALEAAVELSDKYIKGRQFPDKAIDLIDEAASKVKLVTIVKPEAYGPIKVPVVTPFDVEEVLSRWKAVLEEDL